MSIDLVTFEQDDTWLYPITEIRSELEKKIYQLLFSDVGESLSYKLAWLGSAPILRPLIEKEIMQLIQDDTGHIHFASGQQRPFQKEYENQIITGAAIVSSAWAIAATLGYFSGKQARDVALSTQLAVRELIPFLPNRHEGEKIHLTSVFSCPISLSDLLSQNFQQFLNQPIPFNLPIEVAFPAQPSIPSIPNDIAIQLSICPNLQIPVLQVPEVHIAEFLPIPSTAAIPKIDLPNLDISSLNGAQINPNFIPPQTWLNDFLNTLEYGAHDTNITHQTQKKADWLPQFLDTINKGVINPDLLSQELRQPIITAGIETQKDTNWALKFLELIGKEMLYVDFQDPAPLPPSCLSSHFRTEGPKLSHCRIGGINGINTKYETMESHAKYLNQFVSDQSIDWVYNRTHGILTDLTEVFTLNYRGASINTVDLLMDNWLQFHTKNIDRPNAKYLQFCHSQGAIHTKNALMHAPKEIRDRIIVVAIAPACVVPRDLCFLSFNYASKRDIVNYGEVIYSLISDPTKQVASVKLQSLLEKREELVLLDPHPGATGIDHDFQSPTFTEVIKDAIDDYININGEYR